MRQSIIPLVITGVLAVGAGVAIAGLPSEPPAGDLIITEAPTTTTTTIALVADTIAPLPTTTTTTTTTTSTTVLETASTSSSHTTSPTTVPTARALAPRAELAVVTANGTNFPGVAGATADALLTLGYTTVEAVDSPVTVEQSVVYHPDELAAEAIRLTTDLGWTIARVALLDDAPQLTTTVTADLIVLIGPDQIASSDEP